MIHRKHAVRALAAGLMGFALFGAASAGELTVAHAAGETVLEVVPRKVFVYDLAALDTLDTLGVPVAGVPGGPKPPRLAAYGEGDYLTIGTLFEPDFEIVNAETPDLIITGGRSAPKYSELATLAPTIDLTVDRPRYLDSVEENARILGRIFDKEAEVAALLDQLDTSVAELREVAAGAGKGLVILTTGGKMSAYGPGSRFGVIHDTFGMTPAVPDLSIGNHGQPISHEFILETNPDWLFVIDRDAAIGREGQTARQFLDNEIVRRTTAWQKDQVVYLNPADWYLVGGGLQATLESVDALKAALMR